MRETYRRLMQRLYLACIVLSGLAMVAITLIIPLGRVHALRDERPAAVARAGVGHHDGVLLLRRRRRRVSRQPADRGRGADARGRAAQPRARCSGACMPACCPSPRSCSATACTCAFTRDNTIAEFPSLSVGIVYMPIPIGGLLTLLFIVEKIWLGEPPKDDVMYSDAPARTWNRSHGYPGPARLFRAAVRARRAGRLRARPRRADRGVLGRHPARGGDAQDLRRHRRLRAAGDPVLRAGRRHHGRGRHGGAPGDAGQGVRRLHPRRHGGGQRAGEHAVRLHLGLLGRRHLGDRLGDDSADGEAGLHARVRHQRHHLRLGAGAADSALAQRGDLLGRGRRHDLGRAPVPRRRVPGTPVRPVPDRPGAVDRAQAQHAEVRADPAQGRAAHRARGAVGPGDGGDHHRRHPVGRVHAHRVGRGGVRLRVPRHLLRLPRLQVARPAAPRAPRGEDGGDGDDADRLLGRPSAT